MKKYQFETANMGTCTIEIVGDYVDGCKDLAVECGNLYREFDEIDGGGVEEIFTWLIKEGVAFERPQSLWANCCIVASVMLDRDSTIIETVDMADKLSVDKLGRFLEDVADWSGDWRVSWQKDGDGGIDGETFHDPAQAVQCFFDALGDYSSADDGYTVCLGITWPDDEDGDCWDDLMFIRAKTY